MTDFDYGFIKNNMFSNYLNFPVFVKCKFTIINILTKKMFVLSVFSGFLVIYTLGYSKKRVKISKNKKIRFFQLLPVID